MLHQLIYANQWDHTKKNDPKLAEAQSQWHSGTNVTNNKKISAPSTISLDYYYYPGQSAYPHVRYPRDKYSLNKGLSTIVVPLIRRY